MAEIGQGQAGPFAVWARGIDLTTYTISLCIKARGKTIIKTGQDLSVSYADGVTAIVYYLTQDETLALPQGSAEMQIRYVSADGLADRTEIKRVEIDRVLQGGVLPYTGGYSNA